MMDKGKGKLKTGGLAKYVKYFEKPSTSGDKVSAKETRDRYNKEGAKESDINKEGAKESGETAGRGSEEVSRQQPAIKKRRNNMDRLLTSGKHGRTKRVCRNRARSPQSHIEESYYRWPWLHPRAKSGVLNETQPKGYGWLSMKFWT